MAALGDERLFALLESQGDEIARATPSAVDDGALAELVERAAWAKVDVVTADEREHGARIHLNLGHTLGHALEAAGDYQVLLHGEAVAYGLRAAARIGRALDVTPPRRADRIEALLDGLALAVGALPLSLADVSAAMATDKKHASGQLRWVLPTATGVLVSSDVPAALVDRVTADILAGRPADVGSDAAATGSAATAEVG
jgi:3-dehydroquinate synthase